ncbi:hypothetical protein AABB24_021611, partial [Solanum stoloniferum]
NVSSIASPPDPSSSLLPFYFSFLSSFSHSSLLHLTMTCTRTIATLQKAPVSPFASLEVELLSSDSSESESVVHSSSSKKQPSSSKKKDTKKVYSAFPDTFTADDSLLSWGLKHKMRFVSFSKRYVVLGLVINLEQLEASHYAACVD